MLDKYQDKVFPRFLIYDIIRFRGTVEVAKVDFGTRMLCIEVRSYDSI